MEMDESQPLVVKQEVPVKRGRGRPSGSKKKVVQEKDFFLRPHGRPTPDVLIPDIREPERVPGLEQDGDIAEITVAVMPTEGPNQDGLMLVKKEPGRLPERFNQDGMILQRRGPGRPSERLKQDGLIVVKKRPGRPSERLKQDGLIMVKRGPGRPSERLKQDGLIMVKRGPGRPSDRPKPDGVMVVKRGPGRPSERPKLDGVIPGKRKPGRPPINRAHIDHVRKNLMARKKLPPAMLGPEDQKRGRGRPRKCLGGAEIQMLKPAKKGIKKNNLTPIIGGEKKSKLPGNKRCILTPTSHVILSRVNPPELQAVKVVVGGKPRGRPRKNKANEAFNEQQASLYHPELWSTTTVKSEQPHLHSPSEFLPPYGPGYTTEMRFISPDTGLLQNPQDVTSPGVIPHSPWENREVIDEDDSPQEIQECRYPSWESQPAAQWMHSAAEYGGHSLEGSSVTQWVMSRPSVSREPPSPYPTEHHPEPSCNHEGLISELSDFKCQLLKELAATKAEVREGAQLVRSAIAGVSAEISRLGRILQPLVSVITAANATRQDRPMAFVPRFQQDTPPDDILDIIQTSAGVRIPFSDQEAMARPPSTSSDSSTSEAGSVKLEDNMDGPQLCAHQSRSSGTPRVDPRRQKMPGRGKDTSSAVPSSAASANQSSSSDNLHSPSLIISEAS